MGESLKPIVPGCLVLCTCPELLPPGIPIVFKVWRTVEPHVRCEDCGALGQWWELPSDDDLACSCALVRIDPDDDQRAAWEGEERLDRLQGCVERLIASRMRETDR